MQYSLENNLLKHTEGAIKSLFDATAAPSQLVFQETRKEFEGQVTLVVFPITRLSKKSPEQTAQAIGEYLEKHVEEVISFNVIKGFLNLTIKDSYWSELLINNIADDVFGTFAKKDTTVMVEYSSPNTNKPLHLGHIRNNLLGYSVAEILKAYGYHVIKANLINDRGIHICKSMLAWQKEGNGETPESTGLKGDHLVGKYYVIFDKRYKEQIRNLTAQGMSEEEAEKKAPWILEAQDMLRRWEAGDQEVLDLWNKMNGWVYKGFDATYTRMGVDFEVNYYESNTYLLGKKLVEEGLASEVFFKKEDGSVWVDLSDEGLDEKLLLRGDGTSVYMTQDLGTAQLKYDDYNLDQSIYVVGNEQDYHFKVLFSILKKLGKSWASGLHHLSYGMVDLPSGKMKSREGTVVDADDLMDQMFSTAETRTEELGKTDGLDQNEKDSLYELIGQGALKYFLLKVEPKKRLLFNPEESIDFQGHTGPFIQYTHARICSILRKAHDKDFRSIATLESLNDSERELVQMLNNYPKVIEQAAQEMSPAHVANYVFELAKLYNKFYHEESILKAEDKNIKGFRLLLSKATAQIIKKAMSLLGIAVPERM
ncbi:MAG TPA: arginine--tRNA ligase [Candidatus Sphingobacterium stercoripullorum]|uniref:Arginine--tRNA ligase n=1 Tax=Candidatus Sphingobacterium stercoripullorum TaxID=2838759 RepID=A0A9D2AYN9_9SPHI|nr:arginine--tRNA ligase [Candidatus Sphingobacterium stercoripullorum]